MQRFGQAASLQVEKAKQLQRVEIVRPVFQNPGAQPLSLVETALLKRMESLALQARQVGRGGMFPIRRQPAFSYERAGPGAAFYLKFLDRIRRLCCRNFQMGGTRPPPNQWSPGRLSCPEMFDRKRGKGAVFSPHARPVGDSRCCRVERPGGQTTALAPRNAVSGRTVREASSIEDESRPPSRHCEPA